MKITQKNTLQLMLWDVPSLDPIGVTLDDVKDAAGEITITCWGKAWTYYWGSMGKGNTLASFFCGAGVDYLADKLLPEGMRSYITDYDELSREVGEEVFEQTLIFHSKLLEEKYGEYWFEDMPTCVNPEYTYLCRIVEAVQEGIKQWEETK
jgi:hypothetical protein